MKCLLKHGDAEKIIYYATHTKKAEIYMLAAAHLQSMDWHNDNEVMKAIIKFYSAAGAMLEVRRSVCECVDVQRCEGQT